MDSDIVSSIVFIEDSTDCYEKLGLLNMQEYKNQYY